LHILLARTSFVALLYKNSFDWFEKKFPSLAQLVFVYKPKLRETLKVFQNLEANWDFHFLNFDLLAFRLVYGLPFSQGRRPECLIVTRLFCQKFHFAPGVGGKLSSKNFLKAFQAMT
jgi:hypothetical protein